MTSRSDLGAWIAWASGAAIVAAVIAGLMSVANPIEARAQRVDAAHLAAMRQIAEAAQCAYTFTNRPPADLQEIETAFLERRTATRACSRVDFVAATDASASYQADGDRHIRLCADFLRPSPPSAEASDRDDTSDFPELRERRAAAGRHCFRILLVNQADAPD